MPLVHIDCDERYPDYDIYSSRTSKRSIEVPQELIDRHEKAKREYNEVQAQLSNFHDKQSGF